jgi:hypothetical protein
MAYGQEIKNTGVGIHSKTPDFDADSGQNRVFSFKIHLYRKNTDLFLFFLFPFYRKTPSVNPCRLLFC